MSASASMMSVPRNILLATDLGSRGDRALDRAAQLALQWRATLHVVHAMRPAQADPWTPTDALSARPQGVDAATAIERRIRRDLRGEVADLTVHVVEGDPAQTILDTAQREQCGLIVLGAAGETFGNAMTDGTTGHIVRKSPASVLIAKTRVHGAYRNILVGTDFTAESRHGLDTAAAWFPDAEFALMHALDIPYKSLWMDAGRGDEFARMEMDTVAEFIASARISADVRQRIHPRVVHGHPEVMLRNHAIENEVDLTVIGALNRGLAFHVLVGGTARRVVQTVPSDILVVRAPPAG